MRRVARRRGRRNGRRLHRQIRPRRRAVQQCRHAGGRRAAGGEGRGLGPAHDGERQEHVSRLPRRDPAHDPSGRRLDHQQLLDRRHPLHLCERRLRGLEGRREAAVAEHRRAICRQGHPLQRRDAGLHRDAAHHRPAAQEQSAGLRRKNQGTADGGAERQARLGLGRRLRRALSRLRRSRSSSTRPSSSSTAGRRPRSPARCGNERDHRVHRLRRHGRADRRTADRFRLCGAAVRSARRSDAAAGRARRRRSTLAARCRDRRRGGIRLPALARGQPRGRVRGRWCRGRGVAAHLRRDVDHRVGDDRGDRRPNWRRRTSSRSTRR